MDALPHRRYSESLECKLTVMFEPKETDEAPVKEVSVGDEEGIHGTNWILLGSNENTRLKSPNPDGE